MSTETEPATPKQFLEDFVRDIVAHPEARPVLIAGYAKLMESRENAARKSLNIGIKEK